MLDNLISDLIRVLNSNVSIYGWGWIPQLIGGLLAIYGFMILFEEYQAASRKLYSEKHQPTPFPLQFFKDKEMKKMIWLLMIAILVMFILSPGQLCQSWVVILLVMAIIFLFLRGEPRPYYPPPYYPPQSPYKSPAAKPPPPKKDEPKLCKRCSARLELDWVACPICGESTSDKK